MILTHKNNIKLGFKIFPIFFGLIFFCACNLYAQQNDILIKGGHVIDPKNNINSIMDVAISKGKIVQVAANIPAASAKRIVNAKGLYVTPGLIDMHAHHFAGISEERQGDPMPDDFTFRTGVTTSIDAGSSGWKSFDAFKAHTIDKSKTRVLAWLNIVGEGYLGREPWEQNTNDMDATLTAMSVKKNKDYIIGIKVSHYKRGDWISVDRAVEAGKMVKMPVMVDFGEHNPPQSIEELFTKHFRPGDIFTHCFAAGASNRETIVDENGKVKPFVFEAQKRGIVFDVGHGAGAFAFSQAVPALKQGFVPNSISTDFNNGSKNGAMKDILNVMSKFLAMGMDMQTVIKLTTQAPAKQIQREDLGNLSIGSEADVAVFSVRKGDFGFTDVRRDKVKGTEKLEAELTIRAGNIVWDLNGISIPD
ncbi:MAG: amidohydrolase/deacetylase family metallohydrolase [Bacteroidota bacterium]